MESSIQIVFRSLCACEDLYSILPRLLASQIRYFGLVVTEEVEEIGEAVGIEAVGGLWVVGTFGELLFFSLSILELYLQRLVPSHWLGMLYPAHQLCLRR